MHGQSLLKSKKRDGAASKDRYQKVVQAQRDALMNEPKPAEQPKLKSIWETSKLEQFLSVADEREAGYTAERNVHVVVGGNVHVVNKEQRVVPRAEDDRDWFTLSEQKLTIPKRPKWDFKMNKDILQQQEASAFVNWRRSLAKAEESHNVLMTPFEKNIDVWRELWRVVERSDIVLEILDARNPMAFRCPDLERYITSHKNTHEVPKRPVLLLNKADLLSEGQRKVWAEYLLARGDTFFFFSAKPLNPESQQEVTTTTAEEEEDVEEDENEKEGEEDAEEDEPNTTNSNSKTDRENGNGSVVDDNDAAVAHLARHRRQKTRDAAQRLHGAPMQYSNPYELLAARAKAKEAKEAPKAPKAPAQPTTEELARDRRLRQMQEQQTNDGATTAAATTTTPSASGNKAAQAASAPTGGAARVTNAKNAKKNDKKRRKNNKKQQKYGRKQDEEEEEEDEEVPEEEEDEPAGATPAANAEETTTPTTTLSRDLYTVLTPETLLDRLAALRPSMGIHDPNAALMVGTVGYPNVGKSSTINSIIGCKKVIVSATPGKTKHFQTLQVPNERRVGLCDCPGLVFPSFAATRETMICDGILPVDGVRDFVTPIAVICERVPRIILEHVYKVSLSRDDDVDDCVSLADRLLSRVARRRGYMSEHDKPNRSRAAKDILKMYVDGALVFVHPPRGHQPATPPLLAEAYQMQQRQREEEEEEQEWEQQEEEKERARAEREAQWRGDSSKTAAQDKVAAANEMQRKRDEEEGVTAPSSSSEAAEGTKQKTEKTATAAEETDDVVDPVAAADAALEKGTAGAAAAAEGEDDAVAGAEWEDISDAGDDRDLSDNEGDDSDNGDSAHNNNKNIQATQDEIAETSTRAVTTLPMFFTHRGTRDQLTRQELFNFESNAAIALPMLMATAAKQRGLPGTQKKRKGRTNPQQEVDERIMINEEGDKELVVDSDDDIEELTPQEASMFRRGKKPQEKEKHVSKRKMRREAKKQGAMLPQGNRPVGVGGYDKAPPPPPQ